MQRSFSILKFHRLALVLVVGLGLTLAACAGPAATSTAVPLNPTSSANAPAVQPTQAALAPTPTIEASAPTETPATAEELRLVLAAEGNVARYLVTEQLVGFDLPNDAIGETSAITGQIVLAADGTVVSDESKFVVDLTTLKSDQNMRDGFIQRNTLQTATYPTAEFVVIQVTGLPSPLPTSGAVAFQLIGEMTIHGVTKTLTWNVAAEIVGQELVGTARTNFTFGDFGLTIPKVGRVLSIEDNIRLEYDFRLAAQP